MHIGMADAVKIYARMCHARYGALAVEIVRDQVRRLHAKGDRSGVTQWQKVENEIHHLARQRRH